MVMGTLIKHCALKSIISIKMAGAAAVNGASDLDLKQVQSSGYTFQMENGGQSYKGIPFSPLAKSVIMAELRRNGLLKLGWNW